MSVSYIEVGESTLLERKRRSSQLFSDRKSPLASKGFCQGKRAGTTVPRKEDLMRIRGTFLEDLF